MERANIICKLVDYINGENSEKLTVREEDFALHDEDLKKLSPLLENLISNKRHLTKIKNLKVAINLDNFRKVKFIESLKKYLIQQDIEIILLKSTAFHNYIYNESITRASADVDILIKHKDKAKFENIIGTFGKKVNKNDKKKYSNYYEETWEIKKNSSFYVDVHYNITNPDLFNINLNELFFCSIPHPHYKCDNIRTLSVEYNVIHLILHMVNDGYFYHHSLIDILLIKKARDISISEIERLSSSVGCKTATRRTFTILTNKEISHLTKLLYGKKIERNSKLKRIQQVFIYLTCKDKVVPTVLFFIKYFIKK
ncbi:hypothetical protein AltI4_33500 [Alteromonas sp. I4]|nr:hypothetical protein AltI4_33500 [Alteromonas sp. I4]